MQHFAAGVRGVVREPASRTNSAECSWLCCTSSSPVRAVSIDRASASATGFLASFVIITGIFDEFLAEATLLI